MDDIFSGIIKHLKLSDYYLFIDFAREAVFPIDKSFKPNNLKKCPRRGSLFTHQELAIAAILEFENSIFFRQDGVKLEGIGQYLMTNAHEFNTVDELPDLVMDAVKNNPNWSNTYSRHFEVTSFRFDKDKSINYGDNTGSQEQYVCEVQLRNCRPDGMAINVVAFLCGVRRYSKLVAIKSDDLYKPLKWAGQSNAYLVNILHNTAVSFTAFALDADDHTRIYLQDNSDIHDRKPVAKGKGEYILEYKVCSSNFPDKEICVKLVIGDSIETSSACLLENGEEYHCGLDLWRKGQ